MKKHYHGHRNRLKERFSQNPESMFDYEIIELLLGYVVKGKDVKPMAKDLLKHCKGISGIFGCKSSDIKGLGKESDLFFLLIREFYRRVNLDKAEKEKSLVDSPDKVYEFLKYHIGYSEREVFVVLLLDSSNAVKGYEVMAEGTVNQANVYPREIANKALLKGATAAIICHNHPSDNLKPSNDDLRITRKIKEGLSLFDIALLDHLIITAQGFLSFKREGYL
ncbi:JAB domain-containing protein [Flexistipes sinusarabici]|uniref:DNA repair protein RadC n=1 Tax=Flexistipes sinusarabici TaxID=2352 RepID=A0A3D5Q8K2_FLESI|nr:DNA repair protein RadC [Flexistipes sinusarabici]HCW92157.1 DNA repair protein RadC [Flexistipes sinusarabici]